MSVCPGCGLNLESEDRGLDERYNASSACRQLSYNLSVLTLSLGDTDFIQQLVVDAYAAQHSGPKVKTISTAFALIGLSLVFERGYTGKEVQKVHMALGSKHVQWPRFKAPEDHGALTVLDVLKSPEEHYIDMIRKWGKSVWDIWKPEYENIRKLLETNLII
jgi:hypothetical protein